MSRQEYIGAEADLEEIREAALKNAKNTQKSLDLLGVNLLRSNSLATAQSITSTTFVKVNNHQSQVATSGGLIAYIAQISASQPEGQDGIFELRVDDESKTLIQTGIGAGAVRVLGSSALVWVGELPKGNHTFKLYARTTGGTLTVSPSVSSSQTKTDAYILEFLRG